MKAAFDTYADAPRLGCILLLINFLPGSHEKYVSQQTFVTDVFQKMNLLLESADNILFGHHGKPYKPFGYPESYRSIYDYFTTASSMKLIETKKTKRDVLCRRSILGDALIVSLREYMTGSLDEIMSLKFPINVMFTYLIMNDQILRKIANYISSKIIVNSFTIKDLKVFGSEENDKFVKNMLWPRIWWLRDLKTIKEENEKATKFKIIDRELLNMIASGSVNAFYRMGVKKADLSDVLKVGDKFLKELGELVEFRTINELHDIFALYLLSNGVFTGNMWKAVQSLIFVNEACVDKDGRVSFRRFNTGMKFVQSSLRRGRPREEDFQAEDFPDLG